MSVVQNISARRQRYLGDMGVSLRVWVHAMETPHDRLFVFKGDELRSLNLVTAAAAAPVNGPKLSQVVPGKARIHNDRYLLNGFDRDRFISLTAIGCLSALPASELFGRRANLGRPKVCIRSLLPPASWTKRPLLASLYPWRHRRALGLTAAAKPT
jgi:hypothetical protein